MKLINSMKTNNMSKIVFWFFVYTLVTFAIGIICKVLVAWHVDEMHSNLSKTHDMFATAAAMPGSDVILVKAGSVFHIAANQDVTFAHDLTLGDLFSLDYISTHRGSISAGDGSADRFAIVSQHFNNMGADVQKRLVAATTLLHSHDASTLATALQALPTVIPTMASDLNLVAGFQADVAKDADYALSMSNEANMVFWLQMGLIALTLAAYPVGIYKMWKIKHNPIYKYDALTHKRMIVEYVVFLLFFVAIDTYATYLLIAENVPMTFWNAFSVGSMAIPTGFAIGSLAFLHFVKKDVVDPVNLRWNFKRNGGK